MSLKFSQYQIPGNNMFSQAYPSWPKVWKQHKTRLIIDARPLWKPLTEALRYKDLSSFDIVLQARPWAPAFLIRAFCRYHDRLVNMQAGDPPFTLSLYWDDCAYSGCSGTAKFRGKALFHKAVGSRVCIRRLSIKARHKAEHCPAQSRVPIIWYDSQTRKEKIHFHRTISDWVDEYSRYFLPWQEQSVRDRKELLKTVLFR